MIDRMGDKANAKATMKLAGVPCVPGSEGVIETFAECKVIAKRNRISRNAERLLLEVEEKECVLYGKKKI